MAFAMSFVSEGASIAMCLSLGWLFALLDWLTNKQPEKSGSI
jgi:hypothetical protein